MSTAYKQIKQKVVFIFAKSGTPTSTKFGGFVKRLQRYGGLKGVEAHYCALEDLVFVIRDKNHAQIIDARTGFELSAATFAYFKSWESMPEEASATAEFFAAQGIPYLDELVGFQGVSKLVTHLRLWKNGVSVVPTLYARKPEYALAQYEALELDWFPAVVKAVNGEKGRDNYLVSSIDELRDILTTNADKHFLIQPYIPNKGDWRIGIYGEKPRFALKRIGSGQSHLNNTSQGGTAEYAPIETVDADILQLATRAAAAAHLQVSGVDVIEDMHTAKRYVLEVNQGSQIVTGAFVDKNITAFNAFLDETIGHRYAKEAQGKRLRTIGRRTYVDFPEFGMNKVIAKVDTGAYTSSLHAENIRVQNDVLHFNIVQADGSRVPSVAHDFKHAHIRSSNGGQDRYVITTPIIVAGERIQAAITLADRTVMKYPVLLGRRVIRSNFIVNVELSEQNLSE